MRNKQFRKEIEGMKKLVIIHPESGVVLFRHDFDDNILSLCKGYALSMLQIERKTHFVPRGYTHCLWCDELNKPCLDNPFDQAIKQAKKNINEK